MTSELCLQVLLPWPWLQLTCIFDMIWTRLCLCDLKTHIKVKMYGIVFTFSHRVWGKEGATHHNGIPTAKNAGGSIMLRGRFPSSWDRETGQAWVRPEWSKVLENLTQSTQDLRLGWRLTLPIGSGSKRAAEVTRERFRETLWMFLIGPDGDLAWTQSNVSGETWKCPSTNGPPSNLADEGKGLSPFALCLPL